MSYDSSTTLLPPEILSQIFQELPQATLRSCTLTSRSWYNAAIAPLYVHPGITGKNFDSFVAAVCPSINSHIKQNGLAQLVKIMDMGYLVHNGRKSLTARLLGRLKGNLEVFVAPQATFAVNCLAALSHCQRLHTLNLALVSEAIPHAALFRSICGIATLRVLYLPNAYVEDRHSGSTTHTIPSALESLQISGCLSNDALLRLSGPYTVLTCLNITHTTNLTAGALHRFLCNPTISGNLQILNFSPLSRFVSRQRYFQIAYGAMGVPSPEQIFPLVLPPLRALRKLTAEFDSLVWELLIPGGWTRRTDDVFDLATIEYNIRRWAQAIQEQSFDGEMNKQASLGKPVDEMASVLRSGAFPTLHTLEIPSSGSSIEGDTIFGPEDLEDALNDHRLPSLRRVNISCSLRDFWEGGPSCRNSHQEWDENVKYFHKLLQSLAREDTEAGIGTIGEDAAGLGYYEARRR